jgi:hypothetical protein
VNASRCGAATGRVSARAGPGAVVRPGRRPALPVVDLARGRAADRSPLPVCPLAMSGQAHPDAGSP